MITQIKIVRAHFKALYWKKRMAHAERYMRRNLDILSSVGSGKHETEYGEFTVSENNSYPADVIKSALSPREQEMCHEWKWSNSRARVLFPTQYEAAKVKNGYKVSI